METLENAVSGLKSALENAKRKLQSTQNLQLIMQATESIMKITSQAIDFLENKQTKDTLLNMQAELKAPKNMFNDFAKFSYRSLEGILACLKPLLAKHNASLVFNDEVFLIQDRVYIKSTATLILKDGTSIKTTAYAREDESKRGMDGAQITGSASSYARKYALSALFLFDDNKDIDSCEQTIDKKYNVMSKAVHVNAEAKNNNISLKFYAILKESGFTNQEIKDYMNYINVSSKDTTQITKLLSNIETVKTNIYNFTQRKLQKEV